MNRRSFFTKLGLAAATVAVLPSAMTYARRWVKLGSGLLAPGPSIGFKIYDVQVLDNTGHWRLLTNPNEIEWLRWVHVKGMSS